MLRTFADRTPRGATPKRPAPVESPGIAAPVHSPQTAAERLARAEAFGHRACDVLAGSGEMVRGVESARAETAQTPRGVKSAGASGWSAAPAGALVARAGGAPVQRAVQRLSPTIKGGLKGAGFGLLGGLALGTLAAAALPISATVGASALIGAGVGTLLGGAIGAFRGHRQGQSGGAYSAVPTDDVELGRGSSGGEIVPQGRFGPNYSPVPPYDDRRGIQPSVIARGTYLFHGTRWQEGGNKWWGPGASQFPNSADKDEGTISFALDPEESPKTKRANVILVYQVKSDLTVQVCKQKGSFHTELAKSGVEACYAHRETEVAFRPGEAPNHLQFVAAMANKPH